MPACPNFRFFRGAVGSQFRFPSDLALPRVGAAARAAGGMPEYGEYPQVPQPPAILKKKKTGYPLGRKGGYGDGHRLRWVGVTLWATPTPPPPLHGTGLGGRRCTWRRATAICRPSARSSAPAHRWTSRPTPAGGPFWVAGRVGGRGRSRRAGSAAGQCRRPCRRRPQADAAALGCQPRPRRRNGRAARRRRGRVHPGRRRVTLCRAATGRHAAGRHAAGVLQEDGRATRTSVWAERRVRGSGGTLT